MAEKNRRIGAKIRTTLVDAPKPAEHLDIADDLLAVAFDCAFGFEKLVPGRGPALENAAAVKEAITSTRDFIGEVYRQVQAGVAQGKTLNAIYKETVAALRPRYGHWVIFDHCMPFDVTRAYDEATGHVHPRIWTAERDIEMWHALEG